MNQNNLQRNDTADSEFSPTNIFSQLRAAKTVYDKATFEADIAFENSMQKPCEDTIKLAILKQEVVIEAMAKFLQTKQALSDYLVCSNPETRGEHGE